MPEKDVVVFMKISSLKLKEEITDLYIYQDFNKKLFSIYYNDEIKLNIDLCKRLKKNWCKRGF